MFAANLLPVENCRLADFGTGAGFPGLALKIAAPKIQVELIESNKKKCAFLAEVIRVLEMRGVNIHSDRLEEIRPDSTHANVVTARAVGEFKLLLRWSAEALAASGKIMLWLGAEDAARMASKASWVWQPAIKIPDSQRRFILVGHPAAKSPQELV
jgi:16S rRNA (guanine527-N7)-methyltransferase